jgi:hypothetical protein
VASFQLFPEEFEESRHAAVSNGFLGIELRRVVVLGRLAVLQGMDSLVNLLDAAGEGRGAQKSFNETTLE